MHAGNYGCSMTAPKSGTFSFGKMIRQLLIYCFQFPPFFFEGDGGGEAAVWATHCSRARMGSWILSSDAAPPYSPYVSRLVFLRSEYKNHAIQ